MIDQHKSNRISGLFGCLFLLFGAGMLTLGISVLPEIGSDSVVSVIGSLSLLAGLMLIWSGIKTIRYYRKKDQAVSEYESKITERLSSGAIVSPNQPGKEDTLTPAGENPDSFEPDVIAVWEYSGKEWRFMNSGEVRRRLIEGIWVSLGLGLLGGWVLQSRGLTFLNGFIFSFLFGTGFSLLKVVLSNSMFRSARNNKIVFTTNALIINGRFKTLNDDHLKLEYIQNVEINGRLYLEFSQQWMTRGGVTNDQFRIYVPDRYKADSIKIQDYFRRLGVLIK